MGILGILGILTHLELPEAKIPGFTDSSWDSCRENREKWSSSSPRWSFSWEILVLPGNFSEFQENSDIPREILLLPGNSSDSQETLQNSRKIPREFQEFRIPYCRIPEPRFLHSTFPQPISRIPAHSQTAFQHSQPVFPNSQIPTAPIPSFRAPAATPRRPEHAQPG